MTGIMACKERTRGDSQSTACLKTVAAAFVTFDYMDLPHIKVVLYQEKRVPKSTGDRRCDGRSERRDNECARWRLS